MQQAYATSENALSLMAETQTIMGLARAQGPGLPEPGNVSVMNLTGYNSLDVLAAPRECTIHIGSRERSVSLNPEEGTSIDQVCAAVLQPAPSGPQSPAPASTPGISQKK